MLETSVLVVDFFISIKKKIYFYWIEHHSTDAVLLLSALLVRLWYNYAFGKVDEPFFHAGMYDLKNNLEEPICW